VGGERRGAVDAGHGGCPHLTYAPTPRPEKQVRKARLCCPGSSILRRRCSLPRQPLGMAINTLARRQARSVTGRRGQYGTGAEPAAQDRRTVVESGSAPYRQPVRPAASSKPSRSQLVGGAGHPAFGSRGTLPTRGLWQQQAGRPRGRSVGGGVGDQDGYPEAVPALHGWPERLQVRVRRRSVGEQMSSKTQLLDLVEDTRSRAGPA